MSGEKILIKTEGYKVNSPFRERRTFIIRWRPQQLSLDELANAVEGKAMWVDKWVVGIDSNMPWWKVNKCHYCAIRVEREIKNPEMWQRRLCLRHYILERLDLTIPDNKEIYVVFDDDPYGFAYIHGGSNNYRYRLYIDIEKAILQLVGDKYYGYRFIYKRHVNAYPLMSSYDIIVKSTAGSLRLIADTLRELKEPEKFKESYQLGKVIINNDP